MREQQKRLMDEMKCGFCAQKSAFYVANVCILSV